MSTLQTEADGDSTVCLFLWQKVKEKSILEDVPCVALKYRPTLFLSTPIRYALLTYFVARPEVEIGSHFNRFKSAITRAF
jgi:hypothetical protein